MTTNLATCPYCFQPKLDTPATLRPRTAGKDNIDVEIKHTEDLISRLFVERSRLLRKRNEMRSPIYSLPVESLALIFQFACPPVDFIETYGVDPKPSCMPPPSYFSRAATQEGAAYPQAISVLSAVSAHWNNVMSSTPSTWTSCIADNRDLQLMQTIFKRSRHLLISASLDHPCCWVPSDSSIIVPLLQEHISRIRMLHVSNTSPTWIMQYFPNFYNVKHLSLCKIRDSDTTPVSIDSPCIHLVMKNINCHISLSWSKIEILHLAFMPLGVCLELLSKCTQLVEFRLRSPNMCQIQGIQLPSSPFTLPRLKLFEWRVDDRNSVDRAMLHYVRMPVLETFAWWDSCSPLEPSDYISPFFERLPLTLSEVEIGNAVIHHGFSILSYISTLPNVERLVFKKCSTTFMDDVFSSLESPTSLAERPETLTLSKFKQVYVDSFTGHYLKEDKVLGTLRRYCSQLSRLLPESQFRLEFMNNQLYWTPTFKEELVRMVEQGGRVELWEGAKPVGWLPRLETAG